MCLSTHRFQPNYNRAELIAYNSRQKYLFGDFGPALFGVTAFDKFFEWAKTTFGKLKGLCEFFPVGVEVESPFWYTSVLPP